MAPGTCRYCDCTDEQACDEGCAWADDQHTICSSCVQPLEIAGELVRIIGSVLLNRPSATTFEDLTPEQQRLMVQTCRETIDAVAEAVAESMGDDVLEASVEITLISKFIAARCPEQLDGATSISDVVIELLEPHVGSRITLPPGVSR